MILCFANRILSVRPIRWLENTWEWSAERSKDAYDMRVRPVNIGVGSWVVLLLPTEIQGEKREMGKVLLRSVFRREDTRPCEYVDTEKPTGKRVGGPRRQIEDFSRRPPSVLADRPR